MVILSAMMGLVTLQAGNLISNGSFATGQEAWEGGGSKQVLTENGQKYLHVSIKRKPVQIWESMISQSIDVKIPSGQDVTIQFEGRSPSANKVVAMIEDAGQPYNKYVQETFQLQPAWKTYSCHGILQKDLDVGTTHLTFHMGLGAGIIDLRNIRLSSPGIQAIQVKYPQTILNLGLQQEGIAPLWQPEGKAKPTQQTVASDYKGFAMANRLVVDSVGNNPWDSQVGVTVEKGIRAKSIAYMKAWLKSSDKVEVTFVYEQRAAPNSKAVYESVFPDRQWREYKIAVPAGFTLPENGSQVKFFFTGKGVVDLGPVSLEDLGPRADLTRVAQYVGPSPYHVDLAWRKKNDEEIARLRKGSLTIQLKDAKGKPMKNVLVKIHQDTQQFRFGTALSASLLLQDDEDGKKFRAVVKRLFNTVTFGNDLKWNAVGPEIFQDWIYPAQTWLDKNGIELRAHNLVWGSYQYLPMVDRTWTKEKTWEAVQAHVKDYATKMKGKTYVWDVVNEAVPEHELWDKIGWDKFPEVYKLARQIDPKVKLAYNDYDMNNEGHRAGALAKVKAIQDAGAPIDLFGDQCHISRPIVTPKRLKELWDEISSKTGLPIEVTEFDFSSFDDQVQADYVEDFYRTAFAHPKIQAIVMWGFWEKDHWLANKGGHMVRADWTWRPGMTAVDKLINHLWKTSAELKTDANGRVSLPAFYGKYTVTAGAKSQRFNHNSPGTVVRML